MTKYLRSTKGKEFSEAAMQACQNATCSFHMLDSQKPLTLEGIIDEHKKYDAEFPGEPFDFSDEQIKQGLAVLVEHGYAATVED